MKPMSQDEALRIIRNVADHNPHDIPTPAQVAAAVGQAASGLDENLKLVLQMLSAYAALGRVGELIKKQIYHEHPPNRMDAMVTVEKVYEELFVLEALWMMVIPPTPKTLLDQEVNL